MRIKWNFNLAKHNLAEMVGSTENYMKLVLDTLSEINRRENMPTKMKMVKEMTEKTNPKSPGDVLLLGIICGSYNAFSAIRFDKIVDTKNLKDEDISKLINDLRDDNGISKFEDRSESDYADYNKFLNTPIHMCYDKNTFMKDMYNTENDY